MHKEPELSPFSPDLLTTTADRLGAAIPRLEWPEECPSTNDALAQALTADAEAWPDFSVYGTDFQSAGHARLDRTWVVPPRSCLTFSVPVRLPRDADGVTGGHEHGAPAPDTRTTVGWLPLTAGWAVARAVRAAGVAADVKWPNDVLVEGRKLCGILCRIEVVDGVRYAIIGIGLNVHLEEAQLPVPTATSTDLAGGTAGREELLAHILTGLREGLGAMATPDAQIRAAITDAMVTIGSPVRVELGGERMLTGMATGLGAGGELLVRDADDQTHQVSAGDVVHLRRAEAGNLV